MQNKRGVSYGNLDYWSDYCWLCVLASKQVIKAHKTGGCIGCDAGGGKGCCPHCKHTTTVNLRKK